MFFICKWDCFFVLRCTNKYNNVLYIVGLCWCEVGILLSHIYLDMVGVAIIYPSLHLHKGVYPQSDGCLAIVNSDASKGFVDLWVHLSFAIFAIFNLKRQLK